MSRESNEAFEAFAARKGYKPGTWNYIRAAEAWQAALAWVATHGVTPSREPGDGTPEQEAFCAAHCCWSGHHRDCFRATREKDAPGVAVGQGGSDGN